MFFLKKKPLGAKPVRRVPFVDFSVPLKADDFSAKF
jgi:hypothetical protein